MIIFHITTQEKWQEAQKKGFYTAESLKKVGFIHASTAEQVPQVLAAFYQGQADLVLLAIAPEQLEAEIKWEAPVHPHANPVNAITETEIFPHIYGIINLNAVIKVKLLAESSNH